MNYKILFDESVLDDFIKNFYDVPLEDEYLYVALFARKKYCKTLKSTSTDKMQLKRFTARPDNLKNKIKQLEVPLGCYQLKNDTATQESLALYITANYRSMKKANKEMLKGLAETISNDRYYSNIQAEALSMIQRSVGTRRYVDFDIDNKEVDLFLIKNILPDNAYKILETRGGYHVLVEPKLCPKTKWYEEIKTVFKADLDSVKPDLIPVPGTTQGMFVPRFINI